jgi:pyridoxine 4-dehydrogenase
VTARRLAADGLGATPAQLALGWLLQLAPNVLLLAGDRICRSPTENLAAENVTFNKGAQQPMKKR